MTALGYLVNTGQLVSYTRQGHAQPLHQPLHVEMCHSSVQESLWVYETKYKTFQTGCGGEISQD